MLPLFSTIQCLVLIAILGQDSTSAGPRLAYDVLPAITDTETKAFVSLLQLSPEQETFMSSVWAVYLTSRQDELAKSLPGIDRLSIEAANLESSQGFTTATVSAFEAFWSQYLKLQAKLLNGENEFFREFEGVLSDQQTQQMYRIRWQRERARCGRVERAVLSSRVDLSQLVEVVGGDEAAQTAQAVLIQYESAVTPVLTELDDTINQSRVPLMHIAHEIMFLPDGSANTFESPEGKAMAEAGLQKRRDLQRKSARLQTRVATLNDQFVEMLRGVLPEQTYETIRNSYLASAYPKVYPDRQSVRLITDQAVAHLEGEERRALVATIIESYERQHRLLCESMRQECAKWMEDAATDESMNGYDEYAQTLRRLRSSRLGLNAKVLTDIKAAIGESARPELLKAIDERSEDLRIAELMQAADEYPGP